MSKKYPGCEDCWHNYHCPMPQEGYDYDPATCPYNPDNEKQKQLSQMNKEELYKLLKDNLTIKTTYDWHGSQHSLNIYVKFDGKLITKTEQTLEWDDDF